MRMVDRPAHTHRMARHPAGRHTDLRGRSLVALRRLGLSSSTAPALVAHGRVKMRPAHNRLLMQGLHIERCPIPPRAAVTTHPTSQRKYETGRIGAKPRRPLDDPRLRFERALCGRYVSREPVGASRRYGHRSYGAGANERPKNDEKLSEFLFECLAVTIDEPDVVDEEQADDLLTGTPGDQDSDSIIGAKFAQRAVVHGLAHAVRNHDVIAVVRLRLDNQLAFPVVQVSFAPVAEQVFADVGAVQPGEVFLNQVLL